MICFAFTDGFLVSDQGGDGDKQTTSISTEVDRLSKEIDHMKSAVEQLTDAFEANGGKVPIQTNHCPDGWTIWEEHCYFYSLLRKNWNDAENTCENFGGHLAVIDSIDEDGFIEQFIMSSKTISSDWTRNYTWVGAFDFLQEGKWLWVTGRPVNISTYTNWRGTGPNNAQHGSQDEDCMDWSYGGWNDNNCLESYNFVCEKKT